MTRPSSRPLVALLAVTCLASVDIGGSRPFGGAQGKPQTDAALAGTEAMIPMRDGVRLYTQIYAPAHANEALPIVLLRTPYGTGQLNPARVAASLADLAGDGYVFVMQDIRGRFKSDGAFVMLRQPRDRADTNAIDESTDTYDTIDWLLAHVPNNNGRVGIGGTSYGAGLR
jgi:putative CocE/NonD family hydrolase